MPSENEMQEEPQSKRTFYILTEDFPQFFAIISRIRQEVNTVGPDGGVLSSKVVPQVQAVFPALSFNRNTKVGLQVCLLKGNLIYRI